MDSSNQADIGDKINCFIGAKLKKQRIKCGLSQSKLAEFMGCSYQLIQKQESGSARIQADALFNISKILGVSPNYFYEGYKSSQENIIDIPSKGDVIKNGIKKTWNILLVEDNPEDEFLFRRAVNDIVSDQEFSIHSCYDGVEAMDHLRIAAKAGLPVPDIIFLDLNIPKKDGFEILRDIKRDANLLFLPVIVLTNSVKADEMLNCYKLQASGYACKSLDINKFKEKLKTILSYWTASVATPKNY